MKVEIFPWEEVGHFLTHFEQKKAKKEAIPLQTMNTMTVDYFGMIPNDILQIIFSLITSLKDSFSLLLVSKRFYHLVKPNESRWKSLCLKFWKDYKQQLTQQGDRNYSKEGEYDLEWVQRESGKEWFWFSQCFINGRVYKNDFSEIMIGLASGKGENGWGIQITSQNASIGTFAKGRLNGNGIWIGAESIKYIGKFARGDYHGTGTLIYNSGIKYEGQWSLDYFSGKGSITYPDGIQYEGQWNKSQPEFDPRHPMVKEYVEQGLCTNTLSRIMPQKMGCDWPNYYCETCWIHCQQQSSTYLEWDMKGRSCECKNCSRRSK